MYRIKSLANFGNEMKANNEFCVFLEIIFARGEYEARNLRMSYLWSKKWEPFFFRETISGKKLRMFYGLSVLIKELNKGVSTDAKGFYRISNI